MPARLRTVIAIALLTSSAASLAAEWSDTSMGYRTGNKFSEPYNPNDISKDIINLNHASGYKYGSNFFNADLLLSDANDPAGAGSSNGAAEVYIVYRHTLDIEKISGSPMKFGLMRGWGLTFGFDANAKTDAGYNSKKRMLVLGPTLFVDVPGFLNVGLYGLWESNAPYSTYTMTSTPRYSYKPHPMIGLTWGIPLGGSGFSFEGFASFIAAKGKDEFGAETARETNIDMQVMYDVGAHMGAKGQFKLGLEYQYWKNKFGNDASGPAGAGAFAKTAMIRAEYHF